MITKKQFKIIIIALLALYAIIFVARSTYDLITYIDPAISDNYIYSSMTGSVQKTSNVASLRMEYDGVSGIEVLDQKYERVASLTAKSVSYDEDIAKLDAAIEEFQAVVQMENAQGLAGNRRLSRVIGVKPLSFDACLAYIKGIGQLASSTSQTTDKTYEYLQMIAQKEELEKRLESYIALRNHSGSINELLNLEEKIIEVESLLLQQAVSLGEYSDDNALCTINISLYEGNPISIARKLWNAFVWTNWCYFAILGGLLLLSISAVILVKAYLFLSKVFTAERKPRSGADGAADDGGSEAGGGISGGGVSSL